MQKVECPLCDWEFEKEILTDVDSYVLDDEATRHYEQEHCGKVKVKVVLEAEWQLHPGQDKKEMSTRALERFEDEDIPGFEPAYSVVETLEEAEDVE